MVSSAPLFGSLFQPLERWLCQCQLAAFGRSNGGFVSANSRPSAARMVALSVPTRGQMTQRRPVILLTTVCDILALFGRRDLFRLSDVCHRFHAIIQRYFHTAPYLVFDELEYGDCWQWSKWKPNAKQTKDHMPIRLFQSLNESKFVRFQRTTFSTISNPIDRLKPIEHVWEERDLVIDSRVCSTPMTALVRKCRSLSLTCLRATNILPDMLRNLHDHVNLCNSSWSDDRVIVPVTDIVDFLFRKPRSSTSFKDLSIVVFQPLDEENCTQILEAMKEKFLACTAPLLLQFSLSIGRTLFDGDKISFFNKHTKQYLNIIVSGSHISAQIE